MAHSELRAILELLAMLVFDWRTGVLLPLLAVAAILDVRSQRIPNWLVLAGLLYGVVYNTAFPSSPHDGILFPLTGFGLGFLLFLPVYLMRMMGAGDVKLLAMVGAFLGPSDTFYAMLGSLIAGGALAVCYVLVNGMAKRMFHNLTSLFQHGLSSVLAGITPDLRIEASQSAGKLPYGVAIASGTCGYLVLRQFGFL